MFDRTTGLFARRLRFGDSSYNCCAVASPPDYLPVGSLGLSIQHAGIAHANSRPLRCTRSCAAVANLISSMATACCTQVSWSKRRFLLAALLSPVVLGFVPPIGRHRASHGVEVRLDGVCGVRRRSVAVEMAKKKGIDAAKAAALAALEELEKVEVAAMPAPAAAAGPKKEDKKAKKDKKKEGKGGEDSEPAQAGTPVAATSPGSSAKAAREAALAALSALNDDEEELDPKAARKAAKKAGKKGAVAPSEPSPIAAAAGRKVEDRPLDALQSTGDPMEETDLAPAAGAEQQHEAFAEKVEQEITLEEKVRASRPPPRVRIATEGASGSVFLRLEKVSIVFRNQEVLKEASWGVQAGERVGVVGPNGAGKTTQLRIMAGELEPTSGEVVKSSKDMRVAFLRQEFVDELVPERALRDEFLSVFKEEHAVLDKLAQIEKDLAGATDNPDEMDRLLQELTDIQREADRRQVYSLQNKVDKVMDSMGFLPSDADLPVRSFSGGWKMRIGLGKVLLQEPSVLMLDEPTNHLDLDSVEWLESFLKNQQLPMVIVSHDREFLDRVCTKIVDTDGGECVSYTGNYSNFLKQKKARLEAWQRAYENQQKKIQEDKEFINRFRSNSARAAQVKSREAALEKLMKSDEFIKRPPNQGSAFRFRFPPGPRLTGDVISIEHMTHGYGGQTLLDDTSLTVQKGDRVAIIGPNGVGKSTLLRLIMGMEKPREGRAGIVASNAVANYFEQNQADALDLDKTVDETIVEASSTESYNQLRALMAQFMFKGDSIYKKVRQLSGGEKARVALCRMMLKPGNVLCLDEPTNHLDIPAKEILEEACREYEGAIVLISHDRYFVSQVANRIVAVEDKKLAVYEGDYKYYMDKNEEMASKIEKRYVDGVDGIKPVPQIRKDQLDKKNFGGKGGPSGNAKKGIKNAKRMQL